MHEQRNLDTILCRLGEFIVEPIEKLDTVYKSVTEFADESLTSKMLSYSSPVKRNVTDCEGPKEATNDRRFGILL